jgi:Flp pilus assembly protein TadG
VTAPGRAWHQERGSVALVTVLAVTLFVVAAGAGLVAVTDLSATASRARAAADGAALAGAAVSPLASIDTSQQPDEAATAVTAANGAVFVRSDMRGWPLRYGVTVEVVPTTAWVRHVVGPLRAQAAGAVRPGVPTPAE